MEESEIRERLLGKNMREENFLVVYFNRLYVLNRKFIEHRTNKRTSLSGGAWYFSFLNKILYVLEKKIFKNF